MNGTFTSYAAVLMVSAGQVMQQQQRTVRRPRPLTSADPRLITLGISGIIVSALMLARILRITRRGRPALSVSG
jgi:hypothetical protein